MAQLMKLVKPTGAAERATQTTLDTIEITTHLINSWKSPPFQRELRASSRVLCLGAEIAKSGVLPGIITLGVLDSRVYIVDGQHRLHAFILSAAPLAYADVRVHYFTSMADMASEYVALNSALVRLRPDDILKGLEQSNAQLQKIRAKCPYIGYDVVRRGSANSPVLSMSVVIKVWVGARGDVPALQHSAITSLDQLTSDETDALIDFLQVCFEAWHRDHEYARLWGSLNLILCAWLWRRVVAADGKAGRATKLTRDQFKRGLLSLSASADYLDWLVGRNPNERDRSPGYVRIRTIFASRYLADVGTKLVLPAPPWANIGGQHR